MTLRLLIVDGNPIVGRALKALLDGVDEFVVIGVVDGSGREAEKTAIGQPDVALIDADLPGQRSVELIRLLHEQLPEQRVVALGTYLHRQSMMRSAGADAFLLKDAGLNAIRAAIRGTLDSALHQVTNGDRP